MDTVTVEHSVVCAWCRSTIRAGDPTAPVSHGMCIPCVRSTEAFSSETLDEFSQRELDQLPVGVIELDAEGVVRAYNRVESKASGLARNWVLGKHFFTEVAPCTAVYEFQGRYERLVARDLPTREELDFLFAFETGERLASISMNWDPKRGRVTLLVDLGES
jgi:photoactive yellow protein